MNPRVALNQHERLVWSETLESLRRFGAEDRRQRAIEKLRSAIHQADRRHTPAEVAEAERALGVA